MPPRDCFSRGRARSLFWSFLANPVRVGCTILGAMSIIHWYWSRADFNASAPWGTNEIACPLSNPVQVSAFATLLPLRFRGFAIPYPKLMTELPSRLLVEDIDSAVQSFI